MIPERRIVEASNALACGLPVGTVEALASAILACPEGSLRSEVARRIAHRQHRDSALAFVERWREEAGEIDARTVVEALQAAAHAEQVRRDSQSVELARTGPDAGSSPLRRTEQAILQVLDGARDRITLVSFAVDRIPNVARSLVKAAGRGVRLGPLRRAASEASPDHHQRSCVPPGIRTSSSPWRWFDPTKSGSRTSHTSGSIRSSLSMTTSRFKVGDKVRVRPGVSDPDFHDMPLGGWSGTVTEIIEHEGRINCVFRLDERTLASLNPIYKQRCEIDGLESEFMGLGQEEIEPDDGVPVPIEQPTAIAPRPLDLDDQDDRVRMAFGLTHDDFLPDVNEENQHAYYRYLLAHLSLPFRAQHQAGPYSSKLVRLTVTGMVDVNEYGTEECYGLIGVGKEPGGSVEFPLRDIEGVEDEANRGLIEDYAYWLVNFQ